MIVSEVKDVAEAAIVVEMEQFQIHTTTQTTYTYKAHTHGVSILPYGLFIHISSISTPLFEEH